MRRKGPLVHLDDICKEFDILLVDTSVLVRPLENVNKRNKLIDKINFKKTEICSSIFFNKYLKNKGIFFLTKKVYNEFYCPEKITLEEVFPRYNHSKLSKKEHKYFSEICSVVQEKRNLLKSFKKNKKIISLDDFEEIKYGEIFTRNLYLKTKNKLSKVDYDLLITGAILGITRGKTAIFSNDFPLLYSYKSLIKYEHLNSTKYAFFLRIKQDFFSRGIVPNS